MPVVPCPLPPGTLAGESPSETMVGRERQMRAVLLDIEGTVGSIRFVKDVLFPFARTRLGDFVRAHHARPDVATLLAAVSAETGATGLDAQIAHLERWSDEDRKATALKALQGMIWEGGYRSGTLVAHLYDDAVAALDVPADGLLDERRDHAAGERREHRRALGARDVQAAVPEAVRAPRADREEAVDLAVRPLGQEEQRQPPVGDLGGERHVLLAEGGDVDRDGGADGPADDLEGLAEPGPLLLGQGQVVVRPVVGERRLTGPHLAADVDDLAGAPDGLVVGDAVEALDHLGARRAEAEHGRARGAAAAAAARAQHLAQPLVAIAARQQQEEAENAGRRRRDVRVVLVHSEAEIRVVQPWLEADGALERFLDPFAVAGRGRVGLARAHLLTAELTSVCGLSPACTWDSGWVAWM